MPDRISHFLVALLLGCFTLIGTNAQESCPILSVEGPSGIVPRGELAKYTARLDLKGSQIAPSFEWTTSVGEIVSGQGTSSIEVRQPSDSCITVTVEVTGFPDTCPLVASETSCGLSPPVAMKIGEMSNTSPPDLKLITSFGNELAKNPSNQGYVYIAYKPITPPDQIAERERVLAEALTRDRIGHDSRITLVRITSSRDVTEFWRVPPGADNPMCEACEPVRGGCPSIGIERGAEIVKAGDHVEFNVKDRDNVGGLAFHWTVKNGKIESGQGTSSIRVLPVTFQTRPVEATVKVRGLPEGCSDTFEESYAVPCHPYLATSLDVSFWSEYKTLPWTSERKELQGIFARGLRWQPEKIVYIEKGFPLNSTVRTREAAINRIRNYVLRTLKIPRNKLYIRSRIGRSATRLYLVPADSPVLDPSWKESCVQE
ncbi:MAG: hypothetical protein AB7V18_08640 [Pyrinomonadaceae bacterium]